MTRMDRLGIDLSSNVLPSVPYLYFTPAGVERFYRELRDRNGRYFQAKARSIAKVTPEADRMEAENEFIHMTYEDCQLQLHPSQLSQEWQPR